VECSSNELVDAIRRMHELLVQGSMTSRYEPIVDLATGQPFGYEALLPNLFQQDVALARIIQTENRLASRLLELYRSVATETALTLMDSRSLFIQVNSAEIGTQELTASLGQLRSLVGRDDRLVVQIPFSAACDTPCFRQFHQGLHDMGVLVAYAGFAGGPAQLLDQKSFPADFLKFAKGVTRRVKGGGAAQQTAREIIEVAQELGCRTVATNITLQADADVWIARQCTFAQGEFYGSAQIVNQLLNLPRASDWMSTGSIAL
jgi:EAL domain-containing protein (putative c-di-GMP-specific phosphodiesterase class I)